MKSTGILSFMILICLIGRSQNISVENYIDMYKNIAIAEMNRSGIPASVTLAQGILETEHGNSDLVRRSNNHFGIKCKSTWTGERVSHTDDAPNECFRKYSKAEDSYKDHSDYLRSAPRYASLFQLDASDYKGWAHGLKNAGYATNPRYPQILITNIEKYNLQQFDAERITDTNSIVQVKTPVKIKPAVNVSAEDELVIKGNTRSNGLKAFFANKGTSLLAIAVKAGIPLAKLLDFNDLAADGILKNDSWIYLEKKAKQGTRQIHTSLQDETLYDIAQNNGVLLRSLAQFNNMQETDKVKKGAKIRLRSSQQLTLSK